jgi:hypothetical protein
MIRLRGPRAMSLPNPLSPPEQTNTGDCQQG